MVFKCEHCLTFFSRFNMRWRASTGGILTRSFQTAHNKGVPKKHFFHQQKNRAVSSRSLLGIFIKQVQNAFYVGQVWKVTPVKIGRLLHCRFSPQGT